MRKTLLGIAVLCLVAGGAFAKGPIGTVVVPFTFDNEPFYIPCLGEFVDGDGFGEARYHEFETPSGTVHILENWTFTIINVGMTSGIVWVAHAVSPYQENAKLEKGGVAQYVTRGRWVPLDANAPAYIAQATWKFTLNANGELVVQHEEDPEAFHCVGPEQ